MSYYVTYRIDHDWQIRVQEFRTREEAMKFAKTLAETNKPIKVIEGKTLAAWHQPDTNLPKMLFDDN